MALDALLSALEKETDAKVEAILAGAQVEADRIFVDAEAAVARRRRDALAAAGVEARAAGHAKLARFRRTVRHDIMRARADLLERVFDRARLLFQSALCDPAFGTALAAHLQEALAFAPEDEPVTLRCRHAIRPLLQPLVQGAGRFTLVEDESVGHGVYLCTSRSGLAIDNTLEARLMRARGRLAIELARAIEVDRARLE